MVALHETLQVNGLCIYQVIKLKIGNTIRTNSENVWYLISKCVTSSYTFTDMDLLNLFLVLL